MNLVNKGKFILNAPKSYFLAKRFSIPPIMSDIETLNHILKNGCSISRFGDGEFNLMRNVGIKFQKKDEKLAERLREISSFNGDKNVLICIPDIFKSLEGFTSEARKWWSNYLKCTRGFWYEIFRGDLYGDTNLTRFYVESLNKNRDEYVSKLKELWQDKSVLIVEGKKSRLGMGNDLFRNAAGISRILCPASNAFDFYDEILAETKEELNKKKYDLLICALGPTATVLSYDLADEIQSLDLGHIDIEYEWYLSKADTKQAVKNKAVTEVVDFCSDEVDVEYKKQIVGEIDESFTSIKFVK